MNKKAADAFCEKYPPEFGLFPTGERAGFVAVDFQQVVAMAYDEGALIMFALGGARLSWPCSEIQAMRALRIWADAVFRRVKKEDDDAPK